MTMLTHVEEA